MNELHRVQESAINSDNGDFHSMTQDMFTTIHQTIHFMNNNYLPKSKNDTHWDPLQKGNPIIKIIQGTLQRGWKVGMNLCQQVNDQVYRPAHYLGSVYACKTNQAWDQGIWTLLCIHRLSHCF